MTTPRPKGQGQGAGTGTQAKSVEGAALRNSAQATLQEGVRDSWLLCPAARGQSQEHCRSASQDTEQDRKETEGLKGQEEDAGTLAFWQHALQVPLPPPKAAPLVQASSLPASLFTVPQASLQQFPPFLKIHQVC